MPRRSQLLDDSLDMAASGYPSEQRRSNHLGVGNESFVHESTEEVDQVVVQDDSCSAGSDSEVSRCSRCCSRNTVTVTILVCINLLNYMDRFTIPGVKNDVTKFYQINDSQFGLLQTSFICSYMICSPIFGYLGDRFNRKVLMAIGIGLWTLSTGASSFIPKEHFYIFLLFRALIGIGEASYSTVAPTIFADLFERDTRSKVLAIFYFAIPVGSGMGYIVGSEAASLTGHWQWALRITPMLGIVLFFLIVFLVKDPPRGTSEGGSQLQATSYKADLKYLFSNKSFVATALGFTCVSYVAGALSWWAPGFFNDAVNFDVKPGEQPLISETTIPLVFGICTMVAGIAGVMIGSETARRWRSRMPHIDGLVCGVGLLASTPLIFFTLIVSQYSVYAAFVLCLIGETFLCLNWSLVVDIMLAVVIPTRQATASGIQNLFAHALGDAGSPYIVGLISDSIRNHFVAPDTHRSRFISMQYALYSTAVVAALGGGFFLLVAIFYSRDRAAYRRVIEASQGRRDYDDDKLTIAADIPDSLRNQIA